MSVLMPPGPHRTAPPDPELLIEEARRRARRRRQRTVALVGSAVLGGLWLSSLIGRGGVGSGAGREPSARTAASPRIALPEELSVSANGGVDLVDRSGRRHVVLAGVVRRSPTGWTVRRYAGIEWSPDGSKLLALRFSPTLALVVADASGAGPSTFARGAVDGRWSPDGRRVAFVRREPGLGRVLSVSSADGSTTVRIATHLAVFGTPSFSWAPDGKELAFAAPGGSGLHIADAAGRTRPRDVAIPSVGAVGTVEWSPDGSLIGFTSGDDVDVVRPDGASLHRVAKGYGFAWSPGSDRLAVDGPAGASWGAFSVVRVDGSGLRRIARCRCGLRGPGSSQAVAWSVDGTRIAYLSGRGNTVSTIRPDGSGAAVVLTQAARGLSGVWYPSTPLWRPASRG